MGDREMAIKVTIDASGLQTTYVDGEARAREQVNLLIKRYEPIWAIGRAQAAIINSPLWDPVNRGNAMESGGENLPSDGPGTPVSLPQS